MSTGTPYIGTKISLISKAEIRYEGILYAIDTKNATVTLANVRSFGTEDRQTEKKITPRDEVYEYIVFRGQDIKDLHVCEAPAKTLPQDPAIVQSGNVGLPSGGYSHFHAPVSYPQAPAYGPFSGLPSYGGYPPGIQQPFPDRQMPGHIHPGMMPSGPLLPPRIPTPPPSQPMPLSRSHTPSPETVLPTAGTSNPEEVKSEVAQHKATSQQGTQTQGRRRSRPSSRRNSEDKTEATQDKKKQELKDGQTLAKEGDSTKQSGEHPKPQRQGNNRRSQGRRGSSSSRGSKPRAAPVKFEGEFDFESSNAKFKKEEVEEELQQKLNENLRITDEAENIPNSTSTTENEEFHETPQSPQPSFYDGSKSFFDSISCEANDRDRNRRAHPSWSQERKVNMETFGVSGGMRRGGRGRGRGRGGYRGGRGGNRYQGRDGNNRGGNSGWRGGRGSRGNRSRTWVDYPINGQDELPRNVPNGPSAPGAGSDTTAKA